MAITDLTGTTWVLNDTITFSHSLGLSNITSFNFTSNNASFYGFYFDVNGDGDNSLGYRTNQEYTFNEIYDSSGNIYSGEEAYKTIAITGGTDATNATLISWLESNGTLQTPSTPRITCDLATAFPDKWAALTPGEHTIQIRAKNPGNYLDSDLSTAITFVKVVNYTITANLTNCVGVSSNPTTIASNTTGTVLTFTPNTGYDLPASVTVTGATSSWNRSTGELTLTKPTGNVTITIAATAKTYNITVNATNATAASTNPTTIVYGAGAQLKFTFPDGYYAPTAVTVTGATQIWDAATGALTLSNCTGPVTVTIEGTVKTYTITPAITNCTWNGTNPTAIASNQFTPIQLDIIKNTGWTLPTEISVSGVDAEYWSWNQSTGIVTISHPQGNVTVTVNAVREVYNITTNLTHAVAGSGNPTAVGYGLNATLTFTFPTGYEAPADVTVTGATKSWEAGTGTLTLTNAQGPVTVTVVGVATTTTIDGGTYKWLDNAALTEWAQEINFTSNGASYSGMRYTGNGTAMTLQYMNADSEWQTVYNYDEDASTGSWVNDAYKIVDLGTTAQTVTAIFKTDFIANTTKLTQLSTPQNVTADGTVVSWDKVENATSYEVLADGTSIGTVEATPTPTLISFTIVYATYQAEEGMTWGEWCDSKYNTAGYFVSGTDISGNSGGRVYTNNSLTTPVLSTDAIISGWNYGSSESGVGN